MEGGGFWKEVRRMRRDKVGKGGGRRDKDGGRRRSNLFKTVKHYCTFFYTLRPQPFSFRLRCVVILEISF